MARAAPRLGVRPRHGVGVEAAAQAEHLGIDFRAALAGVFQLFQQQHARALTEHEAVALAVERTGHFGRRTVGRT